MKYLFAIIFSLFVLLNFSYAYSCYGDECFYNSKILFSTNTNYNGENVLKYKNNVVESSVYYLEDKKTVDFSLEYNSATRLLIYTIDGNTLQVKISGDDAFYYLILVGKTSQYGGNKIIFSDLQLDGKNIDSFEAVNGNIGVRLELKSKYFKLTGKATPEIYGNTNAEIVGISMYLAEKRKGSGNGRSNSIIYDNGNNQYGGSDQDNPIETQNGENQDETPQEVPEFSTLTAILVLVIAGLFVIKKHKNSGV
ncbi:MAG: hypothetical protein KatS3mg002_1529 [Candidatus Woesearchaeota archaeon]|nr:MAG: hypothetical protein KatS3mg002_1529 [Candidatus Woesearchaeota archaeon]